MSRLLVVLALLGLLVSPAVAQVGYPPGSSPYRDIDDGHSIMPTAGYFGGKGGTFRMGPHRGWTYGLRYDFRTGKSLQFGVGVARGTLERTVVNPFVRLENRFSGPDDQKTTMGDLSAQLNLTGGKSWHRLAPFASLSVGLALGTDVARDTSGYDFGTKLYVAPALGTRVFLTGGLHLRLEARGVFWKLSYPTSFTQEPVEEPGTADDPNAVIPAGSLTEWTLTPWLQAGLGYVIHW